MLRSRWVRYGIVVVIGAAVGVLLVGRLSAGRWPTPKDVVTGRWLKVDEYEVSLNRLRATPVAERERLFAELRPVALSNCTFQRFGEAHDGGYILCGNLLVGAKAAYSYGIDGYDGWGCDVSKTLGVAVHQYDCFNPAEPKCPAGRPVFHLECVAGASSVQEGRIFDSIANQLAKNGDTGHVVMKIDVEGAEWDSLWQTPDDVLDRIDQLAIEFHEFGEPRHVEVLQKLKRFFYVAHVHANNFACTSGTEPFTSWAYEALLVNKRLGIVDPNGIAPELLAIDTPNTPKTPDCPMTFRKK
jgi:hypothetical protein